MKKLVMFDMDGVLFDTMPLHAKSWVQTMAEIGKDFPEILFYQNEGRNGEGMIARMLGAEADHKAIYRRKCQLFSEYPVARVMPGALDAVRAVRRAGCDAIVVTGSGQIHTLMRLQREFEGLFREEWMVTGSDVRHGKPDPEPYLIGLQKAGVKPQEAFVVENAPLGVRSGHAAGCSVLAVNTGPLDDEDLLREGADRLFHSMSELAAFFSSDNLPGVRLDSDLKLDSDAL